MPWTEQRQRGLGPLFRFWAIHYTIRHLKSSDTTASPTPECRQEMNIPAEQITAQLHAADQGPVFITDQGRASYVLLSMDDYRRLSGTDRNIADLLAMPGVEDIDFEPPHLPDVARAADLT
jgi:hypothetical protein